MARAGLRVRMRAAPLALAIALVLPLVPSASADMACAPVDSTTDALVASVHQTGSRCFEHDASAGFEGFVWVNQTSTEVATAAGHVAWLDESQVNSTTIYPDGSMTYVTQTYQTLRLGAQDATFGHGREDAGSGCDAAWGVSGHGQVSTGAGLPFPSCGTDRALDALP